MSFKIITLRQTEERIKSRTMRLVRYGTRGNVRIYFGKLARKFKPGRTSRRMEENFKIGLRHKRREDGADFF